MGTRATVHFYDKNHNHIMTIYHQYDGYVAGGVGEELLRFLKQRSLINGFSYEYANISIDELTMANGIGCLAAQYIALKKTNIGGVYIANKNDEEEYDYTINVHETSFEYVLTIRKHGEIVFSGEIDEIDMNNLQQYDNYEEDDNYY